MVEASQSSYCIRCGKPQDPTSSFCPACGGKQPEPEHLCSGCGAKLSPGVTFCTKCGAKADAATAGESAPTANSSEKFCRACGNALPVQAQFCHSCGATQTSAAYSPLKSESQNILERIHTLEFIDAVFWAVVAGIQVLSAINTANLLLTYDGLADMFGLSGLFSDSWVNVVLLVGLGAWNGYAAYCTFRFCKTIKQTPSMKILNEFQKRMTPLVTVLVVMVLAGSFLGVLAAVYGLIVRYYVLNHKAELEECIRRR